MYLALGIVIVVYVLVSALIVMTLTLPAMEANGGTSCPRRAGTSSDASASSSRRHRWPIRRRCPHRRIRAVLPACPGRADGQPCAFLIVYGTVSLGHLRVYRETRKALAIGARG